MPGSFAYTEATNKIVVTTGTEGAPATFNDMYLADQAGTGTVLNVAENGGAAVKLDYQIRPTHDKALKVKCIVASKTAEADFIFITGTDAWGAAQTESLDVTAGNGSYETTKRFATITNLDCSDGAAGGGAVWADGTIAVTQDIWGVVWEIVADAQYKIDCNVDFGDGETATYFQSKNEMVYFTDAMVFIITSAATLEFGDLSNGYGINGSYWSLAPTANLDITVNFVTGTFNLYDSTLRSRNKDLRFVDGTVVINKGKIIFDIAATEKITFGVAMNSVSIKELYVIANRLIISKSPIDCENVHVHNSSSGISAWGESVVDDLLVTNTPICQARTTGDSPLTIKNSKFVINDVINDQAGGSIIEQYTANIHIADEDGADLETVTVQCQTFGNVVSNDAGSTFYKCIEDHASGVFADDLAAEKWELTTAAYAALAGCAGGAGTGAWVTAIAYVAAASEFSVATDANGDIAEQTIDYKKWVGTSEALLTYGPHTFTYTHADYPDFVMNDVTIDHPIVWRIEMGISTANLTTVVDDAITANKDINAIAEDVTGLDGAAMVGTNNANTVAPASAAAIADAVRAEPLTADETADTLGWMIRKINQNMGLLR